MIDLELDRLKRQLFGKFPAWRSSEELGMAFAVTSRRPRRVEVAKAGGAEPKRTRVPAQRLLERTLRLTVRIRGVDDRLRARACQRRRDGVAFEKIKSGEA